MVNLRILLPGQWPQSRFISPPSIPNSLWLMWLTQQHAVTMPSQFKCQTSDPAATGSHTEPVTLLNQQKRPSSRRRSKDPAGLKWHLGGCSSPSSETWGIALSPRSGSNVQLPFKVLGLAPPRPDRQSQPGGGALAVRMSCGVAPPFSLGRDKPGSVAPLRLVGCLIETPAPSWAYFYSIFLLFFHLPYFPPPQHFTFAFSVYLFTTVLLLLWCCFSLHAWQRKWKKPTWIGFWFGSQYSLAFFPPFLSFCICFAQTFAKMARAPCHWFGICVLYILKVF